jgi:hypothetical protein
MYNNNDYGVDARRYSDSTASIGSPSSSMMMPHFPVGDTNAVQEYIEMWDYVGGVRFRGFVAEKEEQRAMFVFFDQHVIGGDLKAGYVAFFITLLDRAAIF